MRTPKNFERRVGRRLGQHSLERKAPLCPLAANRNLSRQNPHINYILPMHQRRPARPRKSRANHPRDFNLAALPVNFQPSQFRPGSPLNGPRLISGQSV